MRLLTFTAVILAALLIHVSPALASDPAFEAEQAAMEELAALSGEEFEIAYVNAIIAHHQAALEMAQSVADRAPHGAVRDAAGQIITAQQGEIDLLSTFLQDTYGTDPEPDERMMMPESMMEELEAASPARAELMFLLMMREHHQTAIEMGNVARDNATSDTLLEQASMMISSQQEEQSRFATWVDQWYAVEPPEPTGHMAEAMELAAAWELPDTATGEDPTGRPASLPLIALALAALTGAAWWFAAVRRRTSVG